MFSRVLQQARGYIKHICQHCEMAGTETSSPSPLTELVFNLYLVREFLDSHCILYVNVKFVSEENFNSYFCTE